MNERFKVFFIDAPEVAHLKAQIYDEFCYVLVECDEGGKPFDIVGTDGGEPEDQLLVRDWRWVGEALNHFDQESKKKIEELEEELSYHKQDSCH